MPQSIYKMKFLLKMMDVNNKYPTCYWRNKLKGGYDQLIALITNKFTKNFS
jgi:hypothetical protein